MNVTIVTEVGKKSSIKAESMIGIHEAALMACKIIGEKVVAESYELGRSSVTLEDPSKNFLLAYKSTNDVFGLTTTVLEVPNA